MQSAPPHVYSCFVINKTDHVIQCTIHYTGRPNEERFDEDVQISIPADSEMYFARKLFQPDLPKSYCKWVKIITSIKVGYENGRISSLNYPFENVSFPIRNWEFEILDDRILSQPPTRPANLLKYENLDEYER